jgi:AcrR family transcriptional regulator
MPPADATGADRAGKADGSWRSRVVHRSVGEATQRSLDRSHAFVAAAIDLLREVGDAFTVQDVCDRAGYSMRLFYQYFNGKNDLLLAVLEEIIGLDVADYRRPLADMASSLDRLAMYLIYSTSVEPSPLSVALVKYVVELSRTNNDELAHVHRPPIEFMRELINEAVAQGQLPPGDTDPRVYLALSLRISYNHSRLLGNAVGLEMPTPEGFASFCIRGLGGSWNGFEVGTPASPRRWWKSSTR